MAAGMVFKLGQYGYKLTKALARSAKVVSKGVNATTKTLTRATKTASKLSKEVASSITRFKAATKVPRGKIWNANLGSVTSKFAAKSAQSMPRLSKALTSMTPAMAKISVRNVTRFTLGCIAFEAGTRGIGAVIDRLRENDPNLSALAASELVEQALAYDKLFGVPNDLKVVEPDAWGREFETKLSDLLGRTLFERDVDSLDFFVQRMSSRGRLQLGTMLIRLAARVCSDSDDDAALRVHGILTLAQSHRPDYLTEGASELHSPLSGDNEPEAFQSALALLSAAVECQRAVIEQELAKTLKESLKPKGTQDLGEEIGENLNLIHAMSIPGHGTEFDEDFLASIKMTPEEEEEVAELVSPTWTVGYTGVQFRNYLLTGDHAYLFDVFKLL